MELGDFFRDLAQLADVTVRRFADQSERGASISVGCGDPVAASPLQLVLNNKRIPRDEGYYASVSRLVAERSDEELFGDWEPWKSAPLSPCDALSQITLEVEDASPDSTLGVILTLARLANCNVLDFPISWVEAAESWERTGLVEEPRTSWATLCSALAHRHFPVTRNANDDDYAAAWLDTLRFTCGCLARGADPGSLDAMETWDLWSEAKALLAQEEQTYRDWLIHADTLQLSLPLREGAGRRLLVDALLVAEDQATGAAKVFYRNDSESAPLSGGYTLAAHYRPNERKGDGNDFTIALDPRKGVDLLDLWHELERRERSAWKAAGETRPSDDARNLHVVENKYNQPWYIDRERTIIGAPRKLDQDRMGSKLDWLDVREAIWNVYNPLRGVRVIDRVAFPNGPATPVDFTDLEPAVPNARKHLFLAAWPSDRNDPALQCAPRALNLSETATRHLATVAAGRYLNATTSENSFDRLLPPGSWLRVALSGGFAIVTNGGVLILDDWKRDVPLDLTALTHEFERSAELDAQLTEIEKEIAEAVRRLDPAGNARRSRWPKQDDVREVAAITFRLSTLRGSTAGVSNHADARRLRETIDSQWAVDRRLDAMEKQVAAVSSSLKALGDATMWRMAVIVTLGGFSFLLASGLANPFGIFLGFLSSRGRVPLSSASAPLTYWLLAFAINTIVVVFLTLCIMGVFPGLPRRAGTSNAPQEQDSR